MARPPALPARYVAAVRMGYSHEPRCMVHHGLGLCTCYLEGGPQ